MEYNSSYEWTKYIQSLSEIAYPAEYVIRIFKGKYPRLNLDKNFHNKKICDVGCGSGRNFVLLQECGFDLYGVEISDVIVAKVRSNLIKMNINDADIRVGSNLDIPFDDDYFDYLLSWNGCYYMGDNRNFDDYVKEFAHVLKPEGYLILSIPKKTCFIYQDSELLNKGYIIVKNDPFNIRNGEILRIFENEEEIIQSFSKHFKNFVFASVEDDCFGYNYHWHLVICRKK